MLATQSGFIWYSLDTVCDVAHNSKHAHKPWQSTYLVDIYPKNKPYKLFSVVSIVFTGI